MNQEHNEAVMSARKQLEALQTEASKCEGINGNASAVTGTATQLMRTLDTALVKGTNAALVDIAQQAANVVKPLGLKQMATRFEEMRQLAAGEYKPLSRER